MSAGAQPPPPPPPAVDGEQVRPVVTQPSSTSPASMPKQPPPPPLLDDGDEASPDSVSSSVGVDIMSAVGEEQMRPVAPPPPQASTLSAGMQQEPLPLLVPGDEGSTDSVDTEIMSISAAGAARSRAYSPQPPTTPSAKQPFVKIDETIWQDPVSSSGDRSFGSSWDNRKLRPRSPQPSTSKAPMEPDWQPYIEPGDLADYMYARDLSMRRTPMGFWEAQPPSPQLLSSSTGSQFEMQPIGSAADAATAEFTESDFLSDPHNMSASWDRLRPWSPQTSTSSAAMMLELQLLPANTEVTSTDSIYPGVAQNTSAPLGPFGNWTPPPRMRSESAVPIMKLEQVTGPMVEFPPSFDCPTDDQDDSNPPIQKKLRRWPPQELTSPAEREQLEMQARLKAGDERSAGSDICVAENLSVSKGKGKKKRTLSAQPPAPTATIMQPLIKAIDTKADAFAMSVVQNICALVEEKNRRPMSLQPTTSSAPPVQPLEARDEEPVDAGSTSAAQNISVPVSEGPAPAPAEPSISTAATVKAEVPPKKMPGQKNPEDSVYAHVPQNISNIPQLRGLKAGRRHGRLRRLNTQNKMNEKYGPIIQYLGPMVAEESAKQQTQQILIASALDHFAKTINQIADKYEGKVDTTGFTERLEQFKKRMDERAEKRRKRNPNAAEEALPRPPAPPPPPKLSEEEINRRLREETEAAVEALLTGDRSKENPNRFAEIIKSFEAAFRPPSK